MGDRDVADLRQDRVQHRGEVRDGALGHLAVDVGARTEPVWHAAAADRDAVVDGALGVEEAVRGVADGFAALPADRLPDVSGIGSVAIIELFIGSQRRRSPGSAAVKPSVARSTTGALTVPSGVTARPDSISVAGEFS